MKSTYQKRVLLLLCVGLCFSFSSLKAQNVAGDTLRIDLKTAEQQFLKNNLQLISQRYNVDNASAQLITAKLFPNPDFTFSNGIAGTQVSNPAREQTAGLSQLIQTAGKRNKNIELAKIGIQQAKYQFFDLLRTLKYSLHNDFYTIYYQQQSAKVYDKEISSLQDILSAFRTQYSKGNIAEKEVLRIASQLSSLQVEYNNLLVGIDSTQREFRLLINASPNTTISPIVAADEAKAIDDLNTVPYNQLLDSAYVDRYDLKLAQSAVDYSNTNLQLQKALAIPDVSLSLNYDKLGSYGNNFLGGGIEFNLPFFNRNQGGIKQAHIAIDQSKVQLQSTQKQVEADVAMSYKGALRLQKLYQAMDPNLSKDFTRLINGVLDNYKKRNISLLEFLDFYDSYKNNTLQLNNLQQNLMQSLEQLNYVTGTTLFNKKY